MVIVPSDQLVLWRDKNNYQKKIKIMIIESNIFFFTGQTHAHNSGYFT